MINIKKVLVRYRNAIISVIILIGVYLFNIELGRVAIQGTLNNIWEFIKLVPPVFILLGLMDVWLPKESLIKYMGEDSGFKGIVLAFLIGSFAAGPLYAAFPVAAMFMRKGVDFENIMIFIGAWACTKVPMLLIEVSSLGLRFTILRLIFEGIGIIVISKIINRCVTKEEKLLIYKNAEIL